MDVKRALQKFLQFKFFDRRALLYREGRSGENLFILMSGEVKVYKSLSNGRQQIHKLAVIPGDLIACEDIYLDRYSSSAEAISPVTVCYLPKVHLQSVMNRYQEIPDALMRSMARNLNSYIRNIANLGQKNALERVASYLLFLHETHQERNRRSEELRESLTRTELADMIGVTQRTLIRSHGPGVPGIRGTDGTRDATPCSRRGRARVGSPRRDGGGNRSQHPPGVRLASLRDPLGGARRRDSRDRLPLPGAGDPGRGRRGLGLGAHRRRGPSQDRQRHTFPRVRPALRVGELTLPEVQPGSSIMPGKVNPVIAEALIQSVAHTFAGDAAILHAGQWGFFELNTMMPVAAHHLVT